MRYADRCCQYTETFENGKHLYVYTGPCVVTGKPVTVKLPAEGLFAYRSGKFIQDAFPTLNKDEREFLISGMSKEAWDATFSEEDNNSNCTQDGI